MKTCHCCGGNVDPPLTRDCLNPSRDSQLITCYAPIEFTLDDLAQHLRDSGQYAVVRMDDYWVVGIQNAQAKLAEERDGGAARNVQYCCYMTCREMGLLP